MSTVEKVGKTIEEALAAALADLNASRDQIEYEILEEPSRGLFGFLGVKPARVRVSVKEKVAEIKQVDSLKVDPVVNAKTFLQDVFRAMKLEVKIEKLTQMDNVTLNFRGEDLGILIGKHGQTLDALQYLTNLAAHQGSEDRVKIVLDVEDYRKRRAETLARLAKRLADKVISRGERVVLEPMSPQERKIIHMTLQNDNKVMTYSEGEEPFRKVIIALKK